MQIFKEPEEAGIRETDVVPLSRLRPIYPDDSRTIPLERRSCGADRQIVCCDYSILLILCEWKNTLTLLWGSTLCQMLPLLVSGDPVDCWYDDGWWEGYVHITTDTEIVVTFPEGTGDEVCVALDQSHLDEEVRRRLRSVICPYRAGCR